MNVKSKSHILNRYKYAICALLYFLVAWASLAQADVDVDRLMMSNEEPAGVVIEVTDWEEQSWTWAAPLITKMRKRLLSKYPDLDIAIVSHGGDQFQLTKDRVNEQPEAIASLTKLSEQGVNLHVCGVHSGWHDIAEDAYLDIVDVAPSGPAQVRDYVRLGYELIVLEKPVVLPY